MANDVVGLKNIGATYQRSMNLIFHDMVGQFIEIYINDMVIKSHEIEGHLLDLEK